MDEPWYHEFVGQMTPLATISSDLEFYVLLHSLGTLHQTPDHHGAARDLLIYLRGHGIRGCLYGDAPFAMNRLLTSNSEFGINRIIGRVAGGYNTMLKTGLVHSKAVTQSSVAHKEHL